MVTAENYETIWLTRDTINFNMAGNFVYFISYVKMIFYNVYIIYTVIDRSIDQYAYSFYYSFYHASVIY